MTLSAESLSALGLLEQRVANPPRISALYSDFKTYVGEQTPTRGLLKNYVRDRVDEMVDAINLPFQRDLVKQTIELIRQDSGIDYGALAFKGLDNGEVDVTEVQRTLGLIFTNLGEAQRQREQATHYAGVVKHAETYLKTFRTALYEFVCDEDNVETAWTHLSERKRAADALLVDVEAVMTTLAAIRTELSDVVTNVLGQRVQLLLRAESGLRLLQKFTEQDTAGNWGEARHNNTTNPGERGRRGQPTDTDGFAVEEVGVHR